MSKLTGREAFEAWYMALVCVHHGRLRSDSMWCKECQDWFCPVCKPDHRCEDEFRGKALGLEEK